MFGKVLLKHTDVGVSGRRCRIVASLPESTRGSADFFFELNAELFHPVNRPKGIIRQIVHKLGIAHVVAALHRLVIELLHGVINPLRPLALGIRRI